MMLSKDGWLISAMLASVVTAVFATHAEAGRRGYAQEGNQVVAESRFGNGTVVGSIRHTRLGRQVQTPGGNWIYCKRSCAETLRVNTVDFWANEQGAGNGAYDQEDGLLSPWLRWERRY